jgi:hypothetical protein
MPDLVTPGDDRISEILPDDGQKLAVNVAGQPTQIIV